MIQDLNNGVTMINRIIIVSIFICLNAYSAGSPKEKLSDFLIITSGQLLPISLIPDASTTSICLKLTLEQIKAHQNETVKFERIEAKKRAVTSFVHMLVMDGDIPPISGTDHLVRSIIDTILSAAQLEMRETLPYIIFAQKAVEKFQSEHIELGVLNTHTHSANILFITGYLLRQGSMNGVLQDYFRLKNAIITAFSTLVQRGHLQQAEIPQSFVDETANQSTNSME